MFTIQQSVTINRMVDDVFSVLADPARIPQWRPDVLETHSDGVLREVDQEFDEVIQFGGRKNQRFRVELFEANNTLEVTAIGGLGIRPTQRYSVSGLGTQTSVSIQVTVRTLGLFRLLEPLLPRMIAGKWRTYAERLRELVETQPAQAPVEPPAPITPRESQHS